MAGTTGIAWTDATVNFWIGCTHVGPGCGEMIDGRQIGCYAEVFANRKFGIKFGPGEHRYRTAAGYENPTRWQRMHDRGQATMRQNHQDVPVPRWVFANSLSDFFDNEIPPEWRADAWAVIRACPALRWQIVTKRIGNVAKMLPSDWDGGRNYPHVGIIATMVNQDEIDRDEEKLRRLKYHHGVRWVGASIEPQLGEIDLAVCDGLDWVISGGESNQGEHLARIYDLRWAEILIRQCAAADIPYFQKQMGDNPKFNREPFRKMRDSGSRPEDWPRDFRVQQMPRIYDNDPPYQPKNVPAQASLPIAPAKPPSGQRDLF